MNPEDLQAIKDFNRNIAWLKSRDLKKTYTLTAQDVTKMTGWTRETLRRKRDRNEIEFVTAKTGGYRYNIDQINQFKLPQANLVSL